MGEHLTVVACMALVAFGAHIAMQEDMILHPLARLLWKAPRWLHKPLFACPPCMCSAWGIPVALLLAPGMAAYLPIHLLAAAGLAAWLNR